MALKCIKVMYDGDSVNNMVYLSYLIASLKETLLADSMPFFPGGHTAFKETQSCCSG